MFKWFFDALGVIYLWFVAQLTEARDAIWRFFVPDGVINWRGFWFGVGAGIVGLLIANLLSVWIAIAVLLVAIIVLAVVASGSDGADDDDTPIGV